LRAASYAVGLAALTLVLVACPKELPQDLPPDELYRIGRERFERRDWNGSVEALQRFLFQDPGHPKADSAQYLIGESYFQQKQYLTSAAEFLRLSQNRPAGPLADDARYRACQAYYELSPRPELDQEYTEEALDQCRSVILLYPGSPYAEQAAERIKELTDKLARKYYLNAVYYYKRRAYDSAIVYLEFLLATYRGAAVEPEALYTLYEAYMKLGYSEEAEQTRSRLLREYPDSEEAAKVREPTASEAG
jgi:outer membrane protein assembly factor BamD